MNIKKSTRKHKKYQTVYNGKTIHFGDDRYEDYTTHHDNKRKQSYLKRHGNKTDPAKPGFWAQNILWNKPTIQASIIATKTKLKI